MFCTCNNGVMYSYSSVNKSKVGFHLFKMKMGKMYLTKKKYLSIYIYQKHLLYKAFILIQGTHFIVGPCNILNNKEREMGAMIDWCG